MKKKNEQNIDGIPYEETCVNIGKHLIIVQKPNKETESQLIKIFHKHRLYNMKCEYRKTNDTFLIIEISSTLNKDIEIKCENKILNANRLKLFTNSKQMGILK